MFVIQNWKTRWFVLYKNELTYYKTREVCGECVCGGGGGGGVGG